MSRIRFAKTMAAVGCLSLVFSLPGVVNACGLFCAGTCPHAVIPGLSTNNAVAANAYCAALTCTGALCGCTCVATESLLTCGCD